MAKDKLIGSTVNLKTGEFGKCIGTMKNGLYILEDNVSQELIYFSKKDIK